MTTKEQKRIARNARARQLRRDRKAVAKGAAFEPKKRITRVALERDNASLRQREEILSKRITSMQRHDFWEPVAVSVGSTKYFGAVTREDPKIEFVAVAANQPVNVYERGKDGTERVGVAARPTQPAIALVVGGQLLAVLDRQSLAWFVRALKMLSPRGL